MEVEQGQKKDGKEGRMKIQNIVDRSIVSFCSYVYGYVFVYFQLSFEWMGRIGKKDRRQEVGKEGRIYVH